LRTLPLALANAVMGSLLALADGAFRLPIFVLTFATITFLQILSNLANDYGDALSGKDNHKRVGPQRVTISGLVTKKEMKTMIQVFVLLSFFAGSLLIYIGLKGVPFGKIILFFIIGIAAIIAALKYTVGRNPYGYKGLGDLFVFVFFGPVGVIGTYYLHTNWFEVTTVIPSMVIGMFSMGVLNINNLRDIETDRETGKNTLAVQFGHSFSRKYHMLLISAGWIFSIAYMLLYSNSLWQWIFLLSMPLFIINVKNVLKSNDPQVFNNELKRLALATLLFALLFGVGLVI
jgi:1,4-dihydroxy-2-naphthoate polyprenyltransferase